MEHVPEWSRDLPGKLADSWPKDGKGEFVAPVKLTSCTQLDMGDAIVEGLLDSAGIPHFKRYPHYGGFGNLMLGMSAEGVDIYVPETLLEDAQTLLEGDAVNDEEL